MRPLDACFSTSKSRDVIAIGLREIWRFFPLRDDGIIRRGALPSIISSTSIRSSCESRAPVLARHSMNRPNASSSSYAAAMMLRTASSVRMTLRAVSPSGKRDKPLRHAVLFVMRGSSLAAKFKHAWKTRATDRRSLA